MGVEVGDAIPNVEIRVLGDDGRPTPVNTGDILGSGKVVLFAVPGAFTPGCSNLHLPTYTEGAADLAGAGVDLVACVAVNDVWVMGAWSEAYGAQEIQMLSDGNGEFTRKMGMLVEKNNLGFGSRSWRYAAIIDDSRIVESFVEPGFDDNY
ncbi:MAG: peroxiredoxin, partial [Acidimicrobiales bacterium]|nr:peroxiredoxin [Acidimicrobiales bacterium]